MHEQNLTREIFPPNGYPTVDPPLVPPTLEETPETEVESVETLVVKPVIVVPVTEVKLVSVVALARESVPVEKTFVAIPDIELTVVVNVPVIDPSIVVVRP